MTKGNNKHIRFIDAFRLQKLAGNIAVNISHLSILMSHLKKDLFIPTSLVKGQNACQLGCKLINRRPNLNGCKSPYKFNLRNILSDSLSALRHLYLY